ncbi:unnamed protein product [Acanthoscelides obtectus]|uniref:Thyroglobulin type-1 domain-containing protein n=1 Tax=Acanthoscelides obtectus TaxID=200917 RepID=A0A9P0L5R4_ACAOB|nr:unnamed protein product [Acanthoscelides obtectus]CAK1626136.1 hypothetical protein AOBTE_LOCUS3640 [Acanthoscelides obtectus]
MYSLFVFRKSVCESVKMRLNKLLFTYACFIFKIRYVESSGESVLCTKTVCDREVKCEPVSGICNHQNATLRGISFPSPTTCNCCDDYCLEYLHEGDSCSAGNPSSQPVTKMCGPGLACQTPSDADDDGICSRMITDCTKRQDDYDERRMSGTLGSMELRQECDGEGFFESYKCIPGQSCYCVSKNGTRIFGETDFIGVPSFTMQCKCSRDYEEALLITGQDLGPHQHFRCSADGSYDQLQCIDDSCLCVNPFDGSPTYPEDPLTDISKISSETLECYSDLRSGEYYKTCEREYLQALEKMNCLQKQTGFNEIFNYNFPRCDIDGTYKAVQENATHKMCVDKDKTILTVILKTDPLAEKMDCKCLRATSIISSAEKPTCNKDTGNYEPIQCRRGVCRCVDSDGNQVCNKSPCEVVVEKKDKLICS